MIPANCFFGDTVSVAHVGQNRKLVYEIPYTGFFYLSSSGDLLIHDHQLLEARMTPSAISTSPTQRRTDGCSWNMKMATPCTRK